MSATVIDGRELARITRGQVAAQVAHMSTPPGLATILVGDDPASAVYVANKRRACEQVGITSHHHQLPADVSSEALFEVIDRLNADSAVSGVLCQLPLPAHLDALAVTNRIAADKDVDGLTFASAGRLASGADGLRPCTPLGVMLVLEHAGVSPAGQHAVIIGRSNLFGKPMAQLLLGADATVTVCHSRTSDLPAICRQAEILIVAVGRPRLVQGDWVRPGATVIDVGINRTSDGLVGDVDFAAASEVAGVITPVPGGVGPLTIACLLRNTVQAASLATAASMTAVTAR